MTTDPIHALDQASRAHAIASIAHRGALDKIHVAYIEHPRAVAAPFDPVAQWVEHAAAWLHDTVEDTAITADGLLQAGIDPQVIEVVLLLSRSDDVSDADYYARIKAHPAALAVKLSDIDHNTVPDRVAKLKPKKREELRVKYEKARAALA